MRLLPYPLALHPSSFIPHPFPRGPVMAAAYLLALDQGTTSTRAIVYDDAGRNRGSAAREFTQHYPRPGWVEHDTEEIWQGVAAVVPEALAKAGAKPGDLAAIGITNQRET